MSKILAPEMEELLKLIFPNYNTNPNYSEPPSPHQHDWDNVDFLMDSQAIGDASTLQQAALIASLFRRSSAPIVPSHSSVTSTGMPLLTSGLSSTVPQQQQQQPPPPPPPLQLQQQNNGLAADSLAATNCAALPGTAASIVSGNFPDMAMFNWSPPAPVPSSSLSSITEVANFPHTPLVIIDDFPGSGAASSAAPAKELLRRASAPTMRPQSSVPSTGMSLFTPGLSPAVPPPPQQQPPQQQPLQLQQQNSGLATDPLPDINCAALSGTAASMVSGNFPDMAMFNWYPPAPVLSTSLSSITEPVDFPPTPLTFINDAPGASAGVPIAPAVKKVPARKRKANLNTANNDGADATSTGNAESSDSSLTSQPSHYPCEVCKKTFTRPSSLRTHMFTHTGEKPHDCVFPGCGKSFSVRSNLRRHMKIHEEGYILSRNNRKPKTHVVYMHPYAVFPFAPPTHNFPLLCDGAGVTAVEHLPHGQVVAPPFSTC